jgi:hypothetical protein
VKARAPFWIAALSVTVGGALAIATLAAVMALRFVGVL